MWGQDVLADLCTLISYLNQPSPLLLLIKVERKAAFCFPGRSHCGMLLMLIVNKCFLIFDSIILKSVSIRLLDSMGSGFNIEVEGNLGFILLIGKQQGQAQAREE